MVDKSSVGPTGYLFYELRGGAAAKSGNLHYTRDKFQKMIPTPEVEFSLKIVHCSRNLKELCLNNLEMLQSKRSYSRLQSANDRQWRSGVRNAKYESCHGVN